MGGEVKYIAKYAFPDQDIKPGDEVSPRILGLSPIQFHYYINIGSIEAEGEDYEKPHHVYDVHQL